MPRWQRLQLRNTGPRTSMAMPTAYGVPMKPAIPSARKRTIRPGEPGGVAAGGTIVSIPIAARLAAATVSEVLEQASTRDGPTAFARLFLRFESSPGRGAMFFTLRREKP